MPKLPYPHEIREMIADPARTFVEAHAKALGFPSVSAVPPKGRVSMLDEHVQHFGADEGLSRAFVAVLDDAVTFDFSGVQVHVEDVMRAQQRIVDRVFRTPFPTVAVISDKGGNGSIRLLRQDGEILELYDFTTMEDNDGVPEYWFPHAVLSCDLQTGRLHIERHVMTARGVEATYGSEAAFHKALQVQFWFAVGNVAALERTTLDKLAEPPSDKLNKARVKRGKPPIGLRYKVRVRLGAKHEGVVFQGSHASPIPHWRRAHMRHLSDGRVVPVRECRVGLDDAWSTDRRVYEVRQAKL